MGMLVGSLAPGFPPRYPRQEPQDENSKKAHGESGRIDVFANGIELAITDMKHPAVAIDLCPIVQPLHYGSVIVLYIEIIPVGEPILDDDFRLLIVSSAPPAVPTKAMISSRPLKVWPIGMSEKVQSSVSLTG